MFSVASLIDTIDTAQLRARLQIALELARNEANSETALESGKPPLTAASERERGFLSASSLSLSLDGHSGEHILTVPTLDYSNRSRRYDNVASTKACLDTGFKGVLRRQTFQGRHLERTHPRSRCCTRRTRWWLVKPGKSHRTRPAPRCRRMWVNCAHEN